MTIKNGDLPAMPISIDLIVPDKGESIPDQFPYGLTKREQFAMAAMQGFTANSASQMLKLNLQDVAILSVMQADELLKALEDNQ